MCKAMSQHCSLAPAPWQGLVIRMHRMKTRQSNQNHPFFSGPERGAGLWLQQLCPKRWMAVGSGEGDSCLQGAAGGESKSIQASGAGWWQGLYLSFESHLLSVNVLPVNLIHAVQLLLPHLRVHVPITKIWRGVKLFYISSVSWPSQQPLIALAMFQQCCYWTASALSHRLQLHIVVIRIFSQKLFASLLKAVLSLCITCHG